LEKLEREGERKKERRRERKSLGERSLSTIKK
jgi:hypothetical protein